MRSRASLEGTAGRSGTEVDETFDCAWRTDRYREIRGGVVAVDDWASVVFAMVKNDPLYSEEGIERAILVDIMETVGAGETKGGFLIDANNWHAEEKKQIGGGRLAGN
jgi:hypothetical protein